MNQYDDYYYQQNQYQGQPQGPCYGQQQDQYYGQPQDAYQYYSQPQPAPQPVSLQPFKALKIVFLILAIVNTVAAVFLFCYFQIVGAIFSEFGSSFREVGEMYSSMGSVIILLECLPFVIAFWVLFGVFNKKYKKRLDYNESIGYINN